MVFILNVRAFFVERWLFRSITHARINIKDVLFVLLQPNISFFFSFSTFFLSFPFLTTFSPFCFHLLYIFLTYSLLLFLLLSFIFLPLLFNYIFSTTCSTTFFFRSHDIHVHILIFIFQISRTTDVCI